MTNESDPMRAATRLREELRREATREHVEYDVLESYIDGRADAIARDLVEAHAAVCPTCASELRDLQAFAQRKPRPAIWPWIAAAAAAALIALLAALFYPRATPPADQPRIVQTDLPQPIRVIHDATGDIAQYASGQLTGVDPRWAVTVATILKTPDLRAPGILKEILPRQGTLRAPNAEGRNPLVAPVGTILETDRPTFTWKPSNDATYIVSIFTTDAQLVAESGDLRGSEWTPPKALPRGKVYAWQLLARQAGTATSYPEPRHGPARFSVISAETKQEIDDARRSGSHLVVAIACARAGLRAEAERELAALAALNPRDPTVQRLLDDVRHWPTSAD